MKGFGKSGAPAGYDDLVRDLYIAFRTDRGQQTFQQDYARAREAADGFFAAKDEWEAAHK